MQGSFKDMAGLSGGCHVRSPTGLVVSHIAAPVRVELTTCFPLLSSPGPACPPLSSINSEGSEGPNYWIILPGRREDPIGSSPLAGYWGRERLGGVFR
jgi:hypothetical protein